VAPRFEHDARAAEPTVAYFRGRVQQLLHDERDWTWSGQVSPLVHDGVEWGTQTLLHDQTGRAYVSVYVYADARGRGHMRRHAAARPPGRRYLTTPGCQVFDALAHLDPDTLLAAPISGWPEYEAIERHYGDRRAARSGVPLMHHIDEGLRVLHRYLGASARAMRAYCLHPLVQGDAELRASWASGLLDTFEPAVVALALEYRNIANAFLSPMEGHPGYDDAARIARSPLVEVDHMLIADKLQNCKDFRLYHAASHPRAAALERYFQQWLRALDVDVRLLERLRDESTLPAGELGPALRI
jgi:hypothetical protein